MRRSNIPTGRRGGRECDATDIDPSQRVSYCGLHYLRNVIPHTMDGHHPEARCDLFGELGVKYQPAVDLIRAQL